MYGVPSAARSSALLFFFNETAATEIYTLSLHDALPILPRILRISSYGRRSMRRPFSRISPPAIRPGGSSRPMMAAPVRSEEHTSELQSRQYLVGRLLLETRNTRQRAKRLPCSERQRPDN